MSSIPRRAAYRGMAPHKFDDLSYVNLACVIPPFIPRSSQLLWSGNKRLSGPDAMPGRRPCPTRTGETDASIRCPAAPHC